MGPLNVKVKRMAAAHPAALPLPKRQSLHSAGFDLTADIEGEQVLAPLARAAIPTGPCLEIPVGYEAQVRPRSGLALKHGVTCLNSPGTIDADYRGEVKVILINLSNVPFKLNRGDRVAQLVFSPLCQAELEEVGELSSTARGEGGFGSTGR
jgi:dUTP pyrophosphatase